MSTKNKIFSMGIILLIAGITAASLSFSPSVLLQYVFVVSSLSVGVLGILMGRNTKKAFIPSIYYSSIGFVLIALSIAFAVWGVSAIALINVLGFSFLLIGIVEFVFALQILIYETKTPWNVVGVKLAVSALTTIGAALILTMAGFDGYMVLLFFGLLFVALGLTIIQIGRSAGHVNPTEANSVRH